jgi:NTE family protein
MTGEPARRGEETTAFVLCGGGNLGATQVGMLQGLLETGIEPDLIVGSSVGALNGAFLAGKPTMDRVEALTELWSRIRRRDIFPFRAPRLVAGMMGRRNHFFDPGPLRSFLLRLPFGFDRLEASAVPLHVVTTDLETGCPVVLSTGVAIDALMASAAIPGIFPPVRIDGRRLIDGAVSANAPVAQAEALGATRIYVLPTAQDCPEPIETAPDLMLRALQSVVAPRDAEAVSQVATRMSVHVLPVPAGSQPSMFDFTQTDELIARALAETRRWLVTHEA